ncbi:unnamed protein product, partial [Didymodactylos carnosus]
MVPAPISNPVLNKWAKVLSISRP